MVTRYNSVLIFLKQVLVTNNFRQSEQQFNNKMDGRIPSANYEDKSSRLRRSGLFRLFYEIRQSIFTLSGLLST